jgi:hypothetical protein
MPKSKKKDISKNVTVSPLTDEPTHVEIPKESSKPIVKEVKLSKEDKMVQNIIEAVIGKLKPDMDLALKNNFEAIKGNVINEMNDLRNMVETKIPTILEQQQISPDQAVPPSNQVRGLEHNDSTRHPEPAANDGGFDKNTILQMLMQVAPALLQKQQAASAEPSMESMIVQMMMKKMVGDMGKAESQSTAITNYLLKLMIKKDPSIMSAITDENVTPHNEE